MAYNLGPRFPPPPKYFTLLDPGSYQQDKTSLKQNAAPFLSKTPRDTHTGAKLWTQAVYDQSLPRNIQNCSAMLSKQPRFPYEAFSAEDFEELLCKCGIENPCECPTGQEKTEDIICQGKIRRRIFKGSTPGSILGDEGLSTPSRKDHGFQISSNGYQHRIRQEQKIDCPPFYDARVNEATAFYQGCKWSKRSSKRAQKQLEVRPGPADYYLEREPTRDEICAEKVRAYKRKTSKQLRFIEIVQQRNILENRPSPATYHPTLPKGTDLQCTGSKAERFPKSKYEKSPGPADYWLHRDFDPIRPGVPCHASLPEPPSFSSSSKRFKTQYEEGPSPFSYDVNLKLCNFVHCRVAPFGTSAKRFKEAMIEKIEEEDDIVQPLELDREGQPVKKCIPRTWEFKSKTIRMKPLVKKNDEPSPADLPQTKIKINRSLQSQYVAPFFSSEGRFVPWYSWIPIQSLDTPGPATYSLEKLKCIPAFTRGPLYRAKRFPTMIRKTPSPNQYNTNNGIETILTTHNTRLKENIAKQYKYHWEPLKPRKKLSYEEKEQLLLKKAILMLGPEESESKTSVKVKNEEAEVPKTPEAIVTDPKPKMLRTFLYAHPLPKYL